MKSYPAASLPSPWPACSKLRLKDVWGEGVKPAADAPQVRAPACGADWAASKCRQSAPRALMFACVLFLGVTGHMCTFLSGLDPNRSYAGAGRAARRGSDAGRHSAGGGCPGRRQRRRRGLGQRGFAWPWRRLPPALWPHFPAVCAVQQGRVPCPGPGQGGQQSVERVCGRCAVGLGPARQGGLAGGAAAPAAPAAGARRLQVAGSMRCRQAAALLCCQVQNNPFASHGAASRHHITGRGSCATVYSSWQFGKEWPQPENPRSAKEGRGSRT